MNDNVVDITLLAREQERSRERAAGQRAASAAAVDTAGLLDDVRAYIRGYVVLGDEEADFLALWVAHTHSINVAVATPYAWITSAEPGSGKTRVLEVLEQLVARPWFTGRTSAAALPRKIEKDSPTLLLDESDAAFSGAQDYSEALRGILNSGYRRGGKVTLCVAKGKGIDVVDFSTFGPKAIAGLKTLPDTLTTRSVAVRLKRRAPGETLKDFEFETAAALAAPIRSRLERWAPQHLERLRRASMDRPAELTDRAVEVWRPLRAIAVVAGDDWSTRARVAAVRLSAERGDTAPSTGIQLLAKICGLFGDADRVATDDLLRDINADETLVFGGWRHGDGLDGRGLARLLRPYGIEPRQVWFADQGQNRRGYFLADFADSFARYLPSSQKGARSASAARGSESASEKPPELLGSSVSSVSSGKPGTGGDSRSSSGCEPATEAEERLAQRLFDEHDGGAA